MPARDRSRARVGDPALTPTSSPAAPSSQKQPCEARRDGAPLGDLDQVQRPSQAIAASVAAAPAAPIASACWYSGGTGRTGGTPAEPADQLFRRALVARLILPFGAARRRYEPRWARFSAEVEPPRAAASATDTCST
jgi:hypothetical protein